MRKTLILTIKAYKLLLSPFLGQNCRFYPTCANYAVEAIDRFGVFRGGRLAAGRICRCHPWNEGGVDPVPQCAHHDADFPAQPAEDATA